MEYQSCRRLLSMPSEQPRTAQQHRLSLDSLRAHCRSLLVLQGRADLQDRPQGWSLLHIAAGMGQAAAVRFLLAKGADPAGEHATQACVK